MKFKKDGGFGGGKGGYKKSFGGSDFGGKKAFGKFGQGGGGEQKEMFSAVCATCNKACEVPFRPSGDRPVYCRDCFSASRGDAPRADFVRNGGRGFDSRNSTPTPSFAPHAPKAQGGTGTDELKRQIDAVHNKLDVIVKMIQGLAPMEPSPEVSEGQSAPAKMAKKPAKPKKTKK